MLLKLSNRINGFKSQYDPVWFNLKRDKTVKLRVPLQFVDRVKKAIIKRKEKDKVFKFETQDNPPRIVTVYNHSTEVLVFTLKYGTTEEDL
jgi:hypothetical protein